MPKVIQLIFYIIIIQYIAWEDEEEKPKPKINKTVQNPPSQSNEGNYIADEKKSSYEIAYNDYNKKNNIISNPISHNDYYSNTKSYKNSNM